MQKKSNNDLRVAAVVTVCLIFFSLSPQLVRGDGEALQTKPFEDSKSTNFEDPKTKPFEDQIVATKYVPPPIKKAPTKQPEPTPTASNTLIVTGYSQSAEEGTADGITASGRPVAYGVCAADTRLYPFGTIFMIPGYGKCTVWDTGGAIKGNKIDAFFPTRSEAFAWGTRTLKVEVL